MQGCSLECRLGFDSLAPMVSKMRRFLRLSIVVVAVVIVIVVAVVVVVVVIVVVVVVVDRSRQKLDHKSAEGNKRRCRLIHCLPPHWLQFLGRMPHAMS